MFEQKIESEEVKEKLYKKFVYNIGENYIEFWIEFKEEVKELILNHKKLANDIKKQMAEFKIMDKKNANYSLYKKQIILKSKLQTKYISEINELNTIYLEIASNIGEMWKNTKRIDERHFAIYKNL